MLMDQQSLFSDAQAVTVTANSTNVIDTLPGGQNTKWGAGDGQDISLFAQVGPAAFAGGTSIVVTLVSADTADLATNPIVHYTTPSILTAALTAKARLIGIDLPYGKYRRYVGLVYTVVGTMSAGVITAGLVEDLQTLNGTTDYNTGYTVA